jgi:maleate isomerase
MVGSKDIPAKGLIELGGLPSQMSMDTARELLREHPETDTLYFGGPHRPIADKIEEMEREFKVNVVTSLQAVVWEGLRYSGITEPIRGYGKLLQEH